MSIAGLISQAGLAGFASPDSMETHDCRVVTGIYFLIRAGSVVYVGQSTNIFGRVGVHRKDASKIFDSFSFFECPVESLDYLEVLFTLHYQPEHNKNLQCGGTPFIVAEEIKSRIREVVPECPGVYSDLFVKRSDIAAACLFKGRNVYWRSEVEPLLEEEIESPKPVALQQERNREYRAQHMAVRTGGAA